MSCSKFLCDVMLSRVGRWLRAAGYDVEIAGPKMADQKILEWAIAEKRILLTRDRHFLQMEAPKNLLCVLKGNSVEACIEELNQLFAINWLYRPFSRCLLCNRALIEPPEHSIQTQVPPDILAKAHQFWYCQSCDKVYWEGSHKKRMRTKLETWNR